MNDLLTRTRAMALDRQDALQHLRQEFFIPQRAHGGDVHYLCGHSLGLQPRRAATYLNEELDAWRRGGVAGHFSGPRPWYSYHEQLAPALARLAGAATTEVVAMNSLTVNLHLLLVSFYRPTPDRYKLLIDRPAFSSDRYAVMSQIRLHGYAPEDALVEIAPRVGEHHIRDEDLYALIERTGSSLATVLLPGVQYLSGQAFDMRGITRASQAAGATVGFDLAHAIGNLPLALHDWNVDFAVWCSYKYLNGGPGAIGGAYVHERHGRDLPRLAGWWGHDKAARFQMAREHVAMPGAEGWQVSNPSIFAMAPLLAACELFATAGMQTLRAKSLQLTGYFAELLEARLKDKVEIQTPASRGAQLSLRLRVPRDRARTVHARLEARGHICDWREPDVIRAAPVPLYNTYIDVWEFVAALEQELAAANG